VNVNFAVWTHLVGRHLIYQTPLRLKPAAAAATRLLNFPFPEMSTMHSKAANSNLKSYHVRYVIIFG
jgi:hypothetical protein